MEKTTIFKKNKRRDSNSNNKTMSEVLKIDFLLSDVKYSFFIHWLIQILFVIVVGPHYLSIKRAQ